MTLSLRDILDPLKPKWYLPRDPLADEVLNPALASSERFDCMSGYFSASVLKELAHGLAAYLINTDQPFRLLVSAEISIEDQESLKNGLMINENAKTIVENAFQSEASLASALVTHTKSCLSYLVYKNRLEIRVVLMKEGIFHPKQWFFFQGSDIAIINGSANATGAGLGRNVEQLYLQRSWKGVDEKVSCMSDIEFFNDYWNGLMPDSITVDLPTAVAQDLLAKYRSALPPTLDAYKKALLDERVRELESILPVRDFEIPEWLNWNDGPFRHQGEAIRAWESNGHQGIMSMATGAGKTFTSLVAAHRLVKLKEKLLIVIAVPTRPLLRQWEEDVLQFGLIPYVADSGTSQDHLRILDGKIHSLELGRSKTECVIITLNLLKTPEIVELFSNHGKFILLIADEMHNLGVEKFTENPPKVDFKLGLSATPERQYDDEGTKALFHYFGNVIYEFLLDDAIGVCLVPYDYHIHGIELSEIELEKFIELTEKIGRLLGIAGGEPSVADESRIQRLREQRRLVLESANGKLIELEKSLLKIGPTNIHHTLIYCTDKNPQQLLDVNEILTKLKIRFHQITDLESGDKKKVKSTLTEFKNGTLQVITAKRILDEGFNIPEISTAFILASTTVERQWTQRRGRVLRLCPEIGKDHAVIHDFVAIPPDSAQGDPEAKMIVEAELKRVEEFSRLCRNKAERNGPFGFIQELQLKFLIWARI